MNERPDVIIVGAGPAGAVCALLLARAGLDVLVLDRAAFPRPKPCGDCLSFGAGALLHRLGLLDTVLGAPHAPLAGWRIVAPAGAAFEAAFASDTSGPGCAIAIERAVLDELLLRAALGAGARFERAAVSGIIRDASGAVAGVTARGASLMARCTIGADGLHSVIAARLGVRSPRISLRKLSLTAHLCVSGTAAVGEMHAGDGICAGLARIGPGERCNLTVVADAARYGRAVARDPHDFVACAIAALPRLRGRIDTAAIRAAVILASGPFDRPCARIVFDGAALVGDAAGYYDPFTGQGVYQAIASAELLAAHLVPALAAGDTSARALAGYARARSALVSGARRIQRGIELVLSRPVLANRAIRRIRRARAFADALLAVTGDAAPPRALLAPRALASVIFADRSVEDAA